MFIKRVHYFPFLKFCCSRTHVLMVENIAKMDKI